MEKRLINEYKNLFDNNIIPHILYENNKLKNIISKDELFVYEFIIRNKLIYKKNNNFNMIKCAIPIDIKNLNQNNIYNLINIENGKCYFRDYFENIIIYQNISTCFQIDNIIYNIPNNYPFKPPDINISIKDKYSFKHRLFEKKIYDNSINYDIFNLIFDYIYINIDYYSFLKIFYLYFSKNKIAIEKKIQYENLIYNKYSPIFCIYKNHNFIYNFFKYLYDLKSS